MPFFPGMPDKAHLTNVFARYNRGIEPLGILHDDILRGKSDLSIAERELIASIVSSANDCEFCHNAHRVYAASFGIDVDLLDALVDDIDSAPVDAKLKPLLKYCYKLTKTPARMVQDDVEAVLTAGWSDNALHDAILVTALFNFMNRILFGHGIEANEEMYKARLDAVLSKSLEQRTEANTSELGSTLYHEYMKSTQST